MTGHDHATRLGAIDAGTNALRAVVAELSPDGKLERLESLRLPVRLGRGAYTVGELDRGTIDAAIAAFADFSALFERHHVEHYRAVATSALRNSRNREVLLHRIYAETGIELEVITGEEEARLIRKAVRNAYPTRRAPRTVLDLGGGSLEVNLRRSGKWRAASLPIGTVRLMETLDLRGPIDKDEAEMVRRYVRTLLHTFVPQRGKGELEPAAVCGGNAEFYGTLLGQEIDSAESFSIADLDRILSPILRATVDERMKLYEVRRDRAEVMGIAGLVLSTAASELGIRSLLVPGVGLRDALLFELAATLPELREHAGGARAKAALTSARMFAAHLGSDDAHGEQVRRLARRLFDELEPLHRLPPELGDILELSALLHDVGETVHPRSHHKHSEYLVRWGRIAGIDEEERRLVGSLVRAHRKSTPSVPKHASYTELDPARREQVDRLLPLLRLADGLDTDHQQHVRDVRVTITKSAVGLHLDVDGKGEIDPAVYLRKSALFEDTYGRPVTVTIDS